MSKFKPTSLATLPSVIEPMSVSAKYWQKCLQSAKVAKEFAAINCIDMNSMHDLLVTSSTRLAVYEYYSMEVKRQYTAPNMVLLYGAHYRKPDAKLMVSGASDGVVRVWDVKNSKPLRALGLKDKSSKHSSTVRRTEFSGNSKVISFGDDYNIKLWDITEESIVSTFGETTAHNDYIRASHVCRDSSMVISGSYDQSVKIWDQRTPQKSVIQIDHGSPVESVTVRNLMAISVGGDTVKIFDLISGKVLKTMSKTHNKTITCVYNYGHYLLTASIDGHLKVYDQNFNIAASLTYTPSQLLSCALDNKVLAVGANDGLFSVNKFVENPKAAKKFESISNNNKSLSLFDDSFKFGSNGQKSAKKRKNESDEQTLFVKEEQKRPFLQKHDKLLKTFNHTMALNRVLKKEEDPEVVVSFMQELIRRRALRIALAGRDDVELKLIIDFLLIHLKNPRFNQILVDVALLLTDVYMSEINRSERIQSMFKRLNSVINSEIDCLHQLLSLSGQISALVNSRVE